MSKIVKQIPEKRRNELINKLIAYGVYRKNGVHLFELPLADLEREYKIVSSEFHPHSDMGSLHWINRRKKTS